MMRCNYFSSCVVALLLLVLPCWSGAFVIQPSPASMAGVNGGSSVNVGSNFAFMVTPTTASTTSLNMAEDDSDDAEAPKRKRRRKRIVVDDTQVTSVTATTTTAAAAVAPKVEAPPAAPAIELKPRNDTPVQLQVMDVRSAVGGGGSTPSRASSSGPARTAQLSSSSGTSSAVSSSTGTSGATGSIDDSMRQLLEDARRMKEEESEGEEEEDEASLLKAKMRNTLSTVVTADFFVVCAFLLWFLAGIFCSSVLKDDMVQIAFNNNFPTLVQPALGLLMVGSIAGQFLQEEEVDPYM